MFASTFPLTAQTVKVKTPSVPSHRAVSIAQRNADKPEQFTLKQSESVPTTWFHIKGDGSYSMVRFNVFTAKHECNCRFFEVEGICKHLYRVAEEINTRQREAAHTAAEEARRDEEAWKIFADLRAETTAERVNAAPFVPAGLPAGFEWPTCEYHGPYEAAENGVPISWCEGCERVAG